MCNKLVLISLFFLTAMAGSASAADLIWDNNSNDGLWRTAINWSLDRVPENTLPNVDKVKIVSVPGPLIDSATAAKAAYIACGDGGLVPSIGDLHMTGGTLDITSPYDSWTILGYGASDVGTFTIDGGTVTTSSRFFVGFGGAGILNMNGGTLNIGSTFGINYNITGRGYVYLNGGTIKQTGGEGLIMKSPPTDTNCLLDIAGGTLIISGDKKSLVNDYITNGWIKAYNGAGTVAVDYSSGKTIVRAYVESAKAQIPVPLNNAIDGTPYTDLHWVAGSGAASHNVYFGATSPGTFRSNQTETTFDPGQLALNTTYYWRIDEVNGPNTVTGDLWSFTTVSSFTTVGFSDDFNDGIINSSWTKFNTIPRAQVTETGGKLMISAPNTPTVQRDAGLRFATIYPLQSFECSIDFRVPLGMPLTYFAATAWPSNGWWLTYEHPYGYSIWYINEDWPSPNGRWEWGRNAFGNENTAWHKLKITYDAHSMTTTSYVDGIFLNSQTIDLTNFLIEVFMVAAPGMSAPLTVEFDNFSCVSKPGKVAPIASFIYSLGEHTVGENIIFDASASHDSDGNIVSYEWDFGDESTASGQIVNHSYTQKGQYPVTLTVTDNDDLTDSTQQNVIIKTLTADNPDPANGARIVTCDKVLHWTAGYGAVSHDVYLGTDASGIETAERLAGDLDRSGQVNYNDLFILANYWLENPAGSVPYAGVNDDNIVDFSDYAMLAENWMVPSSPYFKGNTAAASYDDPCNFALNTTYYWRIDEVNGPNTVKGNVWSFTTTEIDSNYTLVGKIMCGYQGWFNCPNDDANRGGWVHWGRSGFTPTNCTVDMWPDMTEMGAGEKFLASEFYDGEDHYVFSSYKRDTVLRHFQWMQDYGIDGVYLQRFATELTPDSPDFNHRNTVLAHCRDGANMYGRKYAVMYDLSNLSAGGTAGVINDWKFLVDTMKVGRDPNDHGYMFHKGMPVVAVWGIGFPGRAYTHQECYNLVNFLKNDPNYGGNIVMIGVNDDWCTNPDSWVQATAALADIISPWWVGRYGDTSGAYNFASTVGVPDKAWCDTNGKEYLPVMFPGFSWHNLNGGDLNQIPRVGGQFLWDQVYADISTIDANMIYVAMFDEVDEGTAIFKVTNDPPRPGGVDMFVTYDIDGYPLPSDEYLWLVGQAARALRGEISPVPSTRPVR
jgi:hypothetical protein